MTYLFRITAAASWLALFIASASGQQPTVQAPVSNPLSPLDSATLQVQVRTAHGERPPSLPFIRLFLGDVLIQEGNCDGMGNFTFEYLQSGVYRVHASLAGFEDANEDVRVLPGSRRRIVVRLGEMEEEPFDPAGSAYWRSARSDVRDEVVEARRLRMSGDPEGAIPHLERALELDPNFSIAYGELGLCYMRLTRMDEARKSLESAIEHGPDSLTPYLNLAELLRGQDNQKAMDEVLRKASEVHPDRGELMYLKARARLDVGDRDGAIQSAHEALARDHTHVPQVHLLLAEAYEQRGELYRVPHELEAYLSKNPEGADAGDIRATLERVRKELESIEISSRQYTDLLERYRTGNFNDAANALSQIPWEVVRKAIAFYKKDPRDDSELVAAALLHTDTALLPSGARSHHFSSAIGYLEALQDEAQRQSLEKHWLLTVAYYFQSIEQSLIALPFLTRAAHTYSEDIEIKLALGTTCESAGWVHGYKNLIDRAEKVYRDIIARDPNQVEAHLRLGHILKLKGIEYETLERLNWVLRNSDERELLMVANLILGDVQRGRGARDLALAHYRKAVEINPRCQVAVTAMSHMLQLVGDTVGSHQALRRYLDINRYESSETDSWWQYLHGHSDRFESMMHQLRGELNP
jgi:tetratricopeptide (TPR) repeat protein